jgi:hypothetical protein
MVGFFRGASRREVERRFEEMHHLLLVVFASVWMWRVSSKKASGYYHLWRVVIR